MMHRYRMRSMNEFGPMGDPHRGQGRVLSLLKMQPEISQKDLSYILGITPQSLGELLAKLEKNGYITRETSESDRRAMIIKLTPEGRHAAEQTRDLEMFSCLGEDEKDILGEYLDRIYESLSKQMGDDDQQCGYGSMDEEDMKRMMQEGLKKLRDNLQEFGYRR